jgi:protein SCO1/2
MRFLEVSLGLMVGALMVWAQPGQPEPVQQSYSLVDPNLKPKLPKGLEGVGIDQKLDQQLPLNVQFRDEAGRTVTLGSYYRCPMLCTQILNGMVGALKAVSFDPGRDFEVVAFSFDPRDTPETASAKRLNYVRRYGRANTANGFHFLTGDEANIKQLTEAIGFHYRYDPHTDQFAHASGLMMATPEGRLSRYFYGVEYSPRDLRLGLVEASEHKIGTPVDAVLLFCFHYDPATGKYGAVAMNSLRAGGAVFVLICGSFLFVAWRRDSRRARDSRRESLRHA